MYTVVLIITTNYMKMFNNICKTFLFHIWPKPNMVLLCKTKQSAATHACP